MRILYIGILFLLSVGIKAQSVATSAPQPENAMKLNSPQGSQKNAIQEPVLGNMDRHSSANTHAFPLLKNASPSSKAKNKKERSNNIKK